MDKGRVKPEAGLNLRDKPNGEKLAVLAHDQQVDVLEEVRFYRVRTAGGQLGYVHGDYLELQPAESSSAQSSSSPALPSEAFHLVSFSHPCFIGETAKVDVDFVPALERVAQYAQQHGLKVWVTSSIRNLNNQIAGAIVKPASKSCHHIGHAIDMNLQLDGRLYNSRKLRRDNLGNLPEPIQAFIEAIRADDNLRWGGDFNNQDPVHIDDNFYHQQKLVYQAKLQSRVNQLNA